MLYWLEPESAARGARVEVYDLRLLLPLAFELTLPPVRAGEMGRRCTSLGVEGRDLSCEPPGEAGRRPGEAARRPEPALANEAPVCVGLSPVDCGVITLVDDAALCGPKDLSAVSLVSSAAMRALTLGSMSDMPETPLMLDM